MHLVKVTGADILGLVGRARHRQATGVTQKGVRQGDDRTLGKGPTLGITSPAKSGPTGHVEYTDLSCMGNTCVYMCARVSAYHPCAPA